MEHRCGLFLRERVAPPGLDGLLLMLLRLLLLLSLRRNAGRDDRVIFSSSILGDEKRSGSSIVETGLPTGTGLRTGLPMRHDGDRNLLPAACATLDVRDGVCCSVVVGASAGSDTLSDVTSEHRREGEHGQ